MRITRCLLVPVLLASLAGPAYAQVYYDFSISNAPPAPRYEYVPATRPGYVWAPGYWTWRHKHNEWVEGRWIEDRPGYRWAPERWEQHGKKWKLAKGHWEQDEHWDNGRHNGWDNDHGRDDHDSNRDNDRDWHPGHWNDHGRQR